MAQAYLSEGIWTEYVSSNGKKVALRHDAELIRCRDCKFFTANKEHWLEPPYVPVPMIGATCDSCDFWAGTECKVEPDGFCAWAEPREESES